MAIKLSKGGKVSLSKAATSSGVTNWAQLVIGCSWGENQFETGGANDLDASAFKLGADGKVRQESDFCFYKNLDTAGLHHSGDERTGAKEGDDEAITVTFADLEPGTEKVAFVVTIDGAEKSGKNFGSVVGAQFHIYDPTTGTDIIQVDLSEDFSTETAVVIGELYHHNGEWKFNSIQQGWSGGLKAVCEHYGLDVE